MPSAIVSAGGDLDRLAAPQRLGIGRDGVDLHADDLDLGPRGLHRDGDAAREPAAADRHDDLGQVGDVLQQLEAERALAGDDVGVVERVHEGHARLARALLGRRHALLDRVAAAVHDGAEAACSPRPSTSGASTGMKTSQGTPRARAAWASAHAWLPALPAGDPRARTRPRARRACSGRRGS